MNAKKDKRGRKQRAVAWVLLGVSSVVAWIWLALPWVSLSNRWFSVQVLGEGVEIVCGSVEERKVYAGLQDQLFQPAEWHLIYPRGAWDVRWPEPGVFVAPVWLVCFPLWALVAVTLGGGGALMWSVRRRRAGQRRMTVGAGLVMAGLLLVVGWVWSGWNLRRFEFGFLTVDAWKGSLLVDPLPGRHWGNPILIIRAMKDRKWTGLFSNSGGEWLLWCWSMESPEDCTLCRLVMPLWAPAGAALIGGALLARSGWLARRRASGCCVRCGYDLRGLEDTAQCPECGAERNGTRVKGAVV